MLTLRCEYVEPLLHPFFGGMWIIFVVSSPWVGYSVVETLFGRQLKTMLERHCGGRIDVAPMCFKSEHIPPKTKSEGT